MKSKRGEHTDSGRLAEAGTIWKGGYFSVQITAKSGEKISGNSTRKPSVARMVENVFGCKWSLTVLELVHRGVRRPGAMERAVEGLTTKVLNERLRKLVRYGILEKHSFPEIPPRVEYRLTEFGDKFRGVLEAIEELESSVDS